MAIIFSLQVEKLCYDSSTLREIDRDESTFCLPPGWEWSSQQIAVSRISRELLYPEPGHTHSNMDSRDGSWLAKDTLGEYMSMLACIPYNTMFH